MALSQNSKILVSDITSALAGKQDALGFAPVKSVNGSTPDTNGNVTISATPTTVKGVLGSAWAANSTSMTLPAGGTWFAFSIAVTSATCYGVATGKTNSSFSKPTGYVDGGGTFSGGTTVYSTLKTNVSGGAEYTTSGKLAAIRIA